MRIGNGQFPKENRILLQKEWAIDSETVSTTDGPARNALSFSVLDSLIPDSLLKSCSSLDFFLGGEREETHFDLLLICTKNQTQLLLALNFNHTASDKK